jgi:hypothetical protein
MNYSPFERWTADVFYDYGFLLFIIFLCTFPNFHDFLIKLILLTILLDIFNDPMKSSKKHFAITDICHRADKSLK